MASPLSLTLKRPTPGSEETAGPREAARQGRGPGGVRLALQGAASFSPAVWGAGEWGAGGLGSHSQAPGPWREARTPLCPDLPASRTGPCPVSGPGRGGARQRTHVRAAARSWEWTEGGRGLCPRTVEGGPPAPAPCSPASTRHRPPAHVPGAQKQPERLSPVLRAPESRTLAVPARS